MVQHIKLFTPGPGDVDEDTLHALAQPVLRHYGPEFMKIYNDTHALLQQIYKTQNEVFFVPGPASAVHDMAIGSLAETGQEMIIGCNGFFGDRLIDIAKGYGLTVIPFTAPLGKPLDPGILYTLLQKHPRAQVVAMVHHDTSTTVLNPLRELIGVARQADRVTLVDAVSSLGGVELPVDEWGVDICVTASNKCLEALPGLGFISVSQRAWDLVDKQPDLHHGWFLNLKTWRKYVHEWRSWHPSPVTLPVNIILAVQSSMQKMLKLGLEAHFDKYRRACHTIRNGLHAFGFEMFVPAAYAAPIVTAVRGRPEFELLEFSSWLLNQRSIAIGSGLGDLNGKIFRVGHLGKAATSEYIQDFLSAVEEFMTYKKIRKSEKV